MFTKDSYVDWRANPITKALVRAITENRRGRLEEIADGKSEGTQLYIEIGRVQGIKDAVEFLLNMNGELQEHFLVETENEQTDSAV
jgi:hypothetical protein